MENKFKMAKVVDRGSDLSKTWYVEFYYQHPETGEMHQFKKYISKRLRTKQARYTQGNEIKQQINERLMMGWNPFADELPGKHQLSVILQQAIKRKQQCFTSKRSSWTVEDTYRKFTLYLKHANLEHVTVDHFTKKHALGFLDWVIDTYNICNYSRNNQLQNIKSLFNFMVRREWIVVNPFVNIAKLPVRETPIRLYSRHELDIIAENLPEWNNDLYIVAMLIYYCALRPQEIVRLKKQHIRLHQGIIIVTGDIAKNRTSQPIAIPDAFIETLKEKSWTFPDNYYIFSKNMHPGEKQIAPNRIAEAWRKFCRFYGIADEMKIYDLKHTGGGMAIEAGISVRDIQLQMRHSSLDITEKYLRKFTNTTSQRLITKFPAFGGLSVNENYPSRKLLK